MKLVIILSLFLLCIYRAQCGHINSIEFVYSQFDQHHTSVYYNSPYGVSDVIIRRGAHFNFNILLDGLYRNENVDVQLRFAAYRDELLVHLPSHEHNQWTVNVSPKRKSIAVSIYVPPDAPVGVWNLNVILRDFKGRAIQNYDCPHRIVILFNPWSPEDVVYLENKSLIEEYVLNEKGMTYSYDWTSWASSTWLYNQFKPEVLSAVLFALSKSKLNVKQRRDVTLVTRELTYLANYDGYNGGILRGKWSEPFNVTREGKPATNPVEWTGSSAILLEYYWSGGKPVAFGQCWVFAGLLTSIYRALGIPARSLTTASSAHDYHRDLTVDLFLDQRGLRSRKRRSDGVWNFHAWTQAWFRRDDLGENYNGWQDLDATPQEINDGRYQVGPSSQRALFNSELNKKFETHFIYSEVNSDQVVWIEDLSNVGTWKIDSIDKKIIGQAVATKAIGSDNALNIISLYKPEENTFAERESYKKAARSMNVVPVSLNTSLVPRSARTGLTIQIITPKSVKLGKQLSFAIHIKNPSTKSKIVQLSFRVTSIYYSDKDAHEIKEHSKKYSISGTTTQRFNFAILPEEYLSKLTDFQTLRIEAAVKSETKVDWTQTKFAFEKQSLIIESPKTVSVGEQFTVKVHFNNPLRKKLSGCRFHIEGKRIEKNVKRINDVQPGVTKTVTFTVVATQPLQENIVVTLHSNELKEAKGATRVNVTGKAKRLFAKLVALNVANVKGEDNSALKATQQKYEQYQQQQQMQHNSANIQQAVSEEVTSDNYGRILVEF